MSSIRSEAVTGGDFDRQSYPDVLDPRTLMNRVSTLSPYLKFKRFLDVTLTLIAAPAALIVIALASLAILLVMGRPILFIQNRVGLNGRNLPDCEASDHGLWLSQPMRHGYGRSSHYLARTVSTPVPHRRAAAIVECACW